MSARRRMLYLIGAPGAGKTTLMEAVLAGCGHGEASADPFKHRRFPGGIVLGAERADFGGTDTLPMDIQPRALDWLLSETFPYTAVAAEGDRLANAAFFRALLDAGWALTVAYLDTPPVIAAERRARRGSRQQAAWVRGRETKVERLAALYVAQPEYWLDGTAPLATTIATLAGHPVMTALSGDHHHASPPSAGA